MAAAPQAAPDRPLPLKARSDLITVQMTFSDVPHLVVKDPVALKYHRLRPEQALVLEALDGTVSLESLRTRLLDAFPAIEQTLQRVQDLVTDLHKKGLLIGLRAGQEVTALRRRRKQRREKFKNVFKNILFLRLPGWDPTPLLKVGYPLVRWTFHPLAIVLACGLIIASWLLVLTNFHTFRAQLPAFEQFFGWPNLLWLWVTIAGVKIFHELGHGFACRHYGCECHEMGLMLLVFSPTLYCDASDSWMLKSKWKRFAIGGAGMYVELTISAIALFVWWNTAPGLLHHLALNVYFVGSVTTIIFNANPLLRFDGYFMLSDFCEAPNLRQKSDRLLWRGIGKHVLGLDPPPDPLAPTKNRGWYLLYAWLAFVYRWIILFGIAWFLYSVLKPFGLEVLAYGIVLLAFGAAFYNAGKQVHQLLSQPRDQPVRKSRPLFWLAAIALLLVVIGMLPVRRTIKPAALTQTRDLVPLEVDVPGRLTEIRVERGAEVSKGDILFVLKSDELDDRIRALDRQIAETAEALRQARATKNPAAQQLATTALNGLKARRDDLKRLSDRLTVRAPISGYVIAPTPKPDAPETAGVLPTWSGTPLEKKNVGSYLPASTRLCFIAPTRTVDLVLYVPQAEYRELTIGTVVETRLDSKPDRTLKGKVASLSVGSVTTVPPSLAIKSGGPLATVTSKSGEEELPQPLYRVLVRLDDAPSGIEHQLRGRARIVLESLPLGKRLWRWARRTIWFKL